MVRDLYPSSPGSAATRRFGRGPPRSLRRAFELSELLVDVLGRRRTSARTFPHRVTYHPTCHSLRVTARRRRARCGCCGAVRGLELVELPDADECCGFGGTFAVKNADTSTAMLADKMRDDRRTGRRGLHGRRRLLPDADRRRPAPRASRCAARLHLAEILARDEARLRHERRRRLGPPPSATQPARRSPTRQLRRNLRDATGDDPREARAASSASCPTGRSCAKPAGDQGRRALPHLDDYLVQLEDARHRRGRARPLGARRRRGERDRRRARPRPRARPRSSRSSR